MVLDQVSMMVAEQLRMLSILVEVERRSAIWTSRLGRLLPHLVGGVVGRRKRIHMGRGVGVLSCDG
jgi:hypothetical protein